jgi:hypothetical protein
MADRSWLDAGARGVVTDQGDVPETEEHVAPVRAALQRAYVAGQREMQERAAKCAETMVPEELATVADASVRSAAHWITAWVKGTAALVRALPIDDGEGGDG